MSWLELDDRILEHPKFIRAAKNGGSEAIHMWLGLRAYCGQLLTDGHIPDDMIDEVKGPRGEKKRAMAIAVLVDVGLLEKIDNGLILHNFLKWSRSREEVESRRQLIVNRQRRHRGQPELVTRDSGVTNASVTALVTPSPPLPSDPLPSYSDRIGEDSPEVPLEPAGPPILVFPCNGKPSSWHLTRAQIEVWDSLYPGVQVETECRKAMAWILAKPDRRKTARGMPAFLVGWLGRQNDRGKQGSNGIRGSDIGANWVATKGG